MPLRNHGAHLVALNVPALAAGSAADTSASWQYHRFASDLGVADATQQYLLDASFVVDTTVTGQATHFAAVDLRHYDSAGNLKNRLEYVFGNTFNATALVPVSLFGAAGGGATGGLYNPTGTTLPWALQPGDTISFKRTSNDATGLATPGIGVTFMVGEKA